MSTTTHCDICGAWMENDYEMVYLSCEQCGETESAVALDVCHECDPIVLEQVEKYFNALKHGVPDPNNFDSLKPIRRDEDITKRNNDDE